MSNEQTVYVVDDDDAVRDVLIWLMESVKLPTQCFSAAQDFLDVVKPEHSGCILLDVRMPGMSGIELHRELKRINIDMPVIIITGHGDVPMAVHAMKEGVFDFIEKPFNNQILLDRVQAALAKGQEANLAKAEKANTEERLNLLTEREREVLALVVAGDTNKAIARTLDISTKTVEAHRAKVMRKMGASSLAELVRLANTEN